MTRCALGPNSVGPYHWLDYKPGDVAVAALAGGDGTCIEDAYGIELVVKGQRFRKPSKVGKPCIFSSNISVI